MNALRAASTTVYEPIHRFRLDAPADLLGPLLPALVRLHALPQPPTIRGSTATIEGEVPVAHVHGLRQQLPALTRGEGVLESSFDSYRAVSGTFPTRSRWDDNPLDREEYLLRVAGRIQRREPAGHRERG
jgi:ribosomal protection tetracycline resistance protein